MAERQSGKGPGMHFAGYYLITAPRMRVWQALNDTATLKACIPGCSRIEWVSETALEAAMKVNLGVAQPEFTGDLELSDIIVAERYTLSGKGRGGLLGWARGRADIVLEDHIEGTTLAFSALGEVDSRLAKLGSAIVGRSAQGVIDRFFERFADQIGATSTAIEVPDAGSGES